MIIEKTQKSVQMVFFKIITSSCRKFLWWKRDTFAGGEAERRVFLSDVDAEDPASLLSRLRGPGG